MCSSRLPLAGEHVQYSEQVTQSLEAALAMLRLTFLAHIFCLASVIVMYFVCP